MNCLSPCLWRSFIVRCQPTGVQIEPDAPMLLNPLPVAQPEVTAPVIRLCDLPPVQPPTSGSGQPVFPLGPDHQHLELQTPAQIEWNVADYTATHTVLRAEVEVIAGGPVTIDLEGDGQVRQVLKSLTPGKTAAIQTSVKDIHHLIWRIQAPSATRIRLKNPRLENATQTGENTDAQR